MSIPPKTQVSVNPSERQLRCQQIADQLIKGGYDLADCTDSYAGISLYTVL